MNPTLSPYLAALTLTLGSLLLPLPGLALEAPVAIKEAPKALREAVESPQRDAKFRERDRYRHPLETLEFFGVEPNMSVVEIWPGAGWYTEILAPYLRARGNYIAAIFPLADSTPGYQLKLNDSLLGKLRADPARYDRAQLTALGPSEHWQLAPDNSADRVLTFRNVHNWLEGGYADRVFAAAYRALKPGGVLGVVEHRARPGTSLEQMKDSGYVTEAEVARLAEAAGFLFLSASEINANPRDTKDHPKGVWTLPPRLALGEQDRDKYLAIGESDRMTLRFVKPAKAAK
ncbi:MAG: methyltransferase [Stagnimonas sp.]|nr:methyltransferase [Stagnimonas sp.]